MTTPGETQPTCEKGLGASATGQHARQDGTAHNAAPVLNGGA